MLAALASNTKLRFRCYLVLLLTAPFDELAQSAQQKSGEPWLGMLAFILISETVELSEVVSTPQAGAGGLLVLFRVMVKIRHMVSL